MHKVTFATYCYHKDIARMHAPGFLRRLTQQHGYGNFHEVLLIHQNCNGILWDAIQDVPGLHIIKTENHPNVIAEHGIPDPYPHAEAFYDGPNEPHFYKKHLINLLIAGKEASGDYVLFHDNDVTIERNGPPPWIDVAVDCLNKYPEVFVVCPGEGSRGRDVAEGGYTNIMSQQICLVRKSALNAVDFNTPFPYTPDTIPNKGVAWGQPYKQYYYMWEGVIGRYMVHKKMKRLVLDSNRWRYWHHNPTSTMWTPVSL